MFWWLTMPPMKSFIFALMLAVSASAPALTISAYATGKTTVQASCMPAVNIVLAGLKRYPHPADWKFTVVCDAEGWRKVVRTDPDHVYAITSLPNRVTYFYGVRLVDPTQNDPKPEHTVAHELAHIYLNEPSDEQRADLQAKQWMAAYGLYDHWGY
jgi:hypothetical protein